MTRESKIVGRYGGSPHVIHVDQSLYGLALLYLFDFDFITRTKMTKYNESNLIHYSFLFFSLQMEVRKNSTHQQNPNKSKIMASSMQIEVG